MQSEKYFYTLQPQQGSFTVTEKIPLEVIKNLRTEIIGKNSELAFIYKRIIDILEGCADHLGMVGKGGGDDTGKYIVLPCELEKGSTVHLSRSHPEPANDN